MAIRTPKEDKKCQRSCQSKNPRQAHSSFLVTGVFWRQRFACGGQRFENAKSSDQNDESEEDEKPLINFVAVGQLRLYSQQQHNLLQGLSFARITMMQQMTQVYRNTCDISVNEKHRKIPKGTTRPPKMNKNTLHAFRHTPLWIFNKNPNKPSTATRSQKNFCSSFSEPIMERIKTKLWSWSTFGT